MKPKIVTVKIAELNLDLFVRTSLNHDHALYLAQLLEEGVKLPPIQITTNMRVIEGRHRINAHEVVGRTEIEAEMIEVKDEADLISRAYIANTGGPLPPTTADTEHTVTLLLDRNITQKAIGELLRLPPGLARRYINTVKSKVKRQQIANAARAVTEGTLNVAQAAAQHNVDPDDLKEALGGGKSRSKHKRGLEEMRRGLTFNYKSHSQKNAAFLRSLLEKVEDGDVNHRHAVEIFEHIEHLHKQSARAIADWRKRYETKFGRGSKKAA